MHGHRETTLRREMDAGEVVAVSPWKFWAEYSCIIASLFVEENGDVAGDTFNADIVTRAKPEADWVIVGSFSEVLGNASSGLQQMLVLNREGEVGWHGEIGVSVTVAGATAAFTASVILEGS